MPTLDRRDHDRLIPITFNGQETFQDIPLQEYVSLIMVSNGEYDFFLNGKKYKKAAPFFLCLSERDELELIQVGNYASAQTFSFSPLFLNSSLTNEALSQNTFSKIEDTHDRNLINMFRIHDDVFQGIVEIDTHSFLQIREWFSIIGGETIHTNYNKCVGVQDICDYIGTNRTTLNQKFKEELVEHFCKKYNEIL